MNVNYCTELWDEIKESVKKDGYVRTRGLRANKNKDRRLRDRRTRIRSPFEVMDRYTK
jgi:hypothetical protein